MNPHSILIALWRDGISMRLTPDSLGLVVPAGRMTSGQRSLVLEHKAELIALLVNARGTTEKLLAAAMRVCDQHGDNAAACEEMRQQCLALPPHLR